MSAIDVGLMLCVAAATSLALRYVATNRATRQFCTALGIGCAASALVLSSICQLVERIG